MFIPSPVQSGNLKSRHSIPCFYRLHLSYPIPSRVLYSGCSGLRLLSWVLLTKGFCLFLIKNLYVLSSFYFSILSELICGLFFFRHVTSNIFSNIHSNIFSNTLLVPFRAASQVCPSSRTNMPLTSTKEVQVRGIQGIIIVPFSNGFPSGTPSFFVRIFLVLSGLSCINALP